MNFALWAGLVMGIYLVWWGVNSSGSTASVINTHGFMIVFGGTAAAALISHPLSRLISSLRTVTALFLPSALPTPEAALAEAVRLAQVARDGGGLLSLQDESRDFADGFAQRAISVAIASGETNRTRDILVRQIKQIRIHRQEDANVFRTIGTLSPMFGILGTLLGMIQVMGSLQDPSKVGPAMALALSSAFIGIALANFLCIPIAGQIRLEAMRETLVLEIILEGVLDISTGKAPYLVELNLASYSEQRRSELAVESKAAPEAA